MHMMKIFVIMMTTMTLITFYAPKGEVKHTEVLLCWMPLIWMVSRQGYFTNVNVKVKAKWNSVHLNGHSGTGV